MLCKYDIICSSQNNLCAPIVYWRRESMVEASKWNRGKSIPVSSLDDVSLREAIHEWAEGSQALEELLLICNKNGWETSGCDAGNHGHPPYLDFDLENNFQKLEKIISAVWNFENGSNIRILFGGNPKSGPDWYKTVVDFSPTKKKDAELFWQTLVNVVSSENYQPLTNACKYLLKIVEFLADKESGFSLLLSNGKTADAYTLDISLSANMYNWKYYTEIFESVGFKTKKNTTGPMRIFWYISATNEEDIEEVLKKTLDIFIQKWSLELPNEVSEEMNFTTMAMVMRRKYGTDENGRKRLAEWIEKNFMKPFSEMTF